MSQEYEVKLSEMKSLRDLALDEVRQLRGSTSWRLTAPLRLLIVLIRMDGHQLRRMWNKFLLIVDKYIPKKQKTFLRILKDRILILLGQPSKSKNNLPAFLQLTEVRKKFANQTLELDPQRPPVPQDWQAIDISIVTYNSQQWITGFIEKPLTARLP
jgi:hypothetical protein